MKFSYSYNTKDNERREAVVEAASRDAAYAALKAQGIRPSRVELAPGFANRACSFLRRRAVALVLALVAAVLMVLLWEEKRPERVERRQIYGDQAIVAAGEKSGWAEVFDNAAERVLALFAQPGRTVPPVRMTDAILAQLEVCAKSPTVARDESLSEYRQMRDIVDGMKAELREYLADGGTVREYVQELVKRQDAEISLYKSAERALEDAKRAKLSDADLAIAWRRINGQLRARGIRTIPLPEGQR